MFTLYAHKRIYIYWLFFHFGNTIFCWEKNYQTRNLTPPVAIWIANYIKLSLWLINRWNMIFLSAECRHVLNYSIMGKLTLSIVSMIGLPYTVIVYCLDCVKNKCFTIHAHAILFYKENATWALFTSYLLMDVTLIVDVTMLTQFPLVKPRTWCQHKDTNVHKWLRRDHCDQYLNDKITENYR